MDKMDRLKETQACHRELWEVADHLDDALRRMHAAHMDGWVGELSYMPEAIKAASKTISGNAAEDVNEDIRRNEQFTGEIFKALLDRAAPLETSQ